ncbi:polysaccharide deacetylase family protein [Kamptonema formosum]|uniref:polysaccharide deacetylase family protein n=1 Tax=Kamptonema formosum TaxID=331992 RepID=UPI000349CA49|nr:polysaccharide deacetylase family protein [Oscillatoria sp. PCC 10802]
MADIQSLVWQHKGFLTLGAAVSSFVLGIIVPVCPPPAEGVNLPPPRLTGGAEDIAAVPAVKPAVEQRVKGFTLALATIEQEKASSLSFSVPARFQGQIVYRLNVSAQEKVVALTFDDGPWPSTPAVLDILKRNKIKATFFWVGRHLQYYPDIARRVVAEGHAIGNHTWNHKYHRVDESTAAKEIGRTAALIYQITGVKTSLFRPPGGVLNNGLAACAQKQNMAVAMWSTDTPELRYARADRIVSTVLNNVQSGGVVLMHDGGGDRSATVRALPKIIAELKKRGYKFVTLPELLEMKDKQLQVAAAAASAKRAGEQKKAPVNPQQ